MLLAMALAAAHPAPAWPLTCGNHSPLEVSSSFFQAFHGSKTKQIAKLFGATGVWRFHGRTLVGSHQIADFLAELHRSGTTIELLGNDASFFSKERWSLTGPYTEHKIGAPASRHDVLETYAVGARCIGSGWQIEEFETPRQ